MFDATALRAIADELNEKILHGRVQEIVQPDALTFGFEIYAQHERRYLYVSVRPDDARVHLVAIKLRGGESSTSFRMLLRKYTEGALIDSIMQIPHERVLKIRFDHSVEGVSTLVVETIGKYANLILLDANDRVIDAAKRVGAEVNRARVVLPHHPYAPPPPQAKFAIAELTAAEFAETLAEHRSARLWQVLVKTIAGVSPLLAREVAFRIAGNTDAACDPTQARQLIETLETLTRALRSEPAAWQPTVAFEDGEPAAFAPYPLTHFADARPFDSISAAIEAFYGAPESYAAVKASLRAQIAEARDRLARKRDALAHALPRAEEIERWKTRGELILAYAYQIAPAQDMLKAETAAGIVEIPLDPRWSAVENAQACFKEYHRAKDAAARVPALLAAANAEVEYAEQMLNDLELADGQHRAEIDAVRQAAHAAGLITAPRQRLPVAPSEPRKFTSRDGFTILVGKNARQNEEITFRRAKPDDLWLHARNVAGAHVVVVRAGREVSEATIAEAAALAAQSSQARNDSAVDVIVTARKNVRRVRGGRPGMVSVTHERIVRTKPNQRTSEGA